MKCEVQQSRIALSASLRQVYPAQQRLVARISMQRTQRGVVIDLRESAVSLLIRPLQPLERPLLLATPSKCLGNLVRILLRVLRHCLFERLPRLLHIPQCVLRHCDSVQPECPRIYPLESLQRLLTLALKQAQRAEVVKRKHRSRLNVDRSTERRVGLSVIPPIGVIATEILP